MNYIHSFIAWTIFLVTWGVIILLYGNFSLFLCVHTLFLLNLFLNGQKQVSLLLRSYSSFRKTEACESRWMAVVVVYSLDSPDERPARANSGVHRVCITHVRYYNIPRVHENDAIVTIRNSTLTQITHARETT